MSDTLVPLSGGQHAKLRPVEDVSERLRRPIANATASLSKDGWAQLREGQRIEAKREKKEDLTEEEKSFSPSFSAADLLALNEANDHSVVALVESWTRPEPVSMNSILDLPSRDYDALRRACAPAVRTLFVDFGASKESDSPTGPSSESDTSSLEGASTNALAFPSSGASTG